MSTSDDHMDDERHAMLLAFDREGDENVPFALGFECGRIWALCRSDQATVCENVHVENGEMMLRIGEATGRPVQSVDLNDEWIEVSFGEAT